MTAPDAAEWRGALALSAREIRRVMVLWTQTILPAVLTGVLFLAIFGGALGDRLDVEGIPYGSFVLPGLLVLTAAGQSFSNSSTSVFQAKNEGYIEDVLTSPLRPWHQAAGYMIGGVVRGMVAAAAVAGLALPFVGTPDHPLTALLVLGLTAVIFSALGVATGVWADTFDQHALVANLVVTPLALVGGVFYSARSLPEPWSTLTRLDPLFYLVDAARYGVSGFHEASVAVSLTVATAAAAAAVAALVALIRSGWRLKP